MRRNGFTWIEFVVVLAILGGLAAMIFPVVLRAKDSSRRSACLDNLHQIALGFYLYEQDNNGYLPPLGSTRNSYWGDLLQPHLKSWQTFQCPVVRKGAPKKTDYFFNGRLAQFKRSNLKSESQTILAGDGNADSPPSSSLPDLPKSWLTDQSSPARRHLDGANYAFVDGHVKWLKPEKISAEKPQQNHVTFAIR